MNSGTIARLLSSFLALCLISHVCTAQQTEFKTEQSAQEAATKKFSDLGKPNSDFSKAFLERVARNRKDSPDYFGNPSWPWILAHEVNATLTKDPKEVLWISQQPYLKFGERKGVIVSFQNLSEKRTVSARIKAVFEDGTSNEKEITVEPRDMEVVSFNSFQKPVRSAEIVSAQFK